MFSKLTSFFRLRKGRLTKFHSLVDELGAGRVQHPDAVSILSQALEFGADFAVDDPEPPGRLLDGFDAHFGKFIFLFSDAFFIFFYVRKLAAKASTPFCNMKEHGNDSVQCT